MNVNNYIKKRLLIFICTLSIISLLLIGSSYSFKNSSFNSDKIVNNNLYVAYNMSNSYSYPMSKDYGRLYASSNIISIENKNSYDIEYELIINKVDEEDSLDLNKIYYSINGSNAKVLKDGINYVGKISANSKINLDIKVFPGQDLIDESDDGKYINLNYNIREK